MRHTTFVDVAGRGFASRLHSLSHEGFRNLLTSVERDCSLATKLIPKRIRLGIGSKSQRSESVTGFIFQSRGFGVFLAGNRRLVAILLGFREAEEQSR